MRLATGRATDTDPGTDAPAAQELTDAAKRAFCRVKRNAGQFPVTERVPDRTIALPFFNTLSGAQIESVCSALRRAIHSLPRRRHATI